MKRFEPAYATALLGAVLVLSACGGGGGSSSPAPTPTPTPTPTPAASFSIGGTITGLGNTFGLMLVNGTETLRIDANASNFNFVNKLAQSSAYNVSVSIQPTGVSCTVSGASGTVASADVQSVAVSCSAVQRTSPYVVSTFAGDDGQTQIDGVGTAARFNDISGIARDGAGNLYVSDGQNNNIRKISPLGAVSTFAGNGSYGSVDGAGATAQFSGPSKLTADFAGNLYVLDNINNAIRKVSPAGVVSTVAVNLSRSISAIAVDSLGNVYAVDYQLSSLSKITSTGTVSLMALTGLPSDTGLSSPNGMSIDSADNLYVADAGNCAIKKITSSGLVTTLVGGPGKCGFADGVGSAAKLSNSLSSLAVDAAGNVFVKDASTLRKITPNATVSSLAGGTAGYVNGTGSAARLDTSVGLVADSAGNIFVAEGGNRAIRMVSPAGVVTTWIGQGPRSGYLDAIGSLARFGGPSGVGIDAAGNVYVADQQNNAIRKITVAGAVTTLAGSRDFGHVDATGTAAQFSSPSMLALDAAGNVYVLDDYVRKVTPSGVVTTLGQVKGAKGIASDSAGTLYITLDNAVYKMTPDGAVTTFATLSAFSSLRGIAVDAGGNVYVAAYANNAIVKITPQGQATLLAGGGYGFIDGVGAAARFAGPLAVAVDAVGNIYVAGDEIDAANISRDGGTLPLGGAVRKITPAGVVTTVAGTGHIGHADGPGASATFSFGPLPAVGVAVDANGNVYVSDNSNYAIRKITPIR